MEIVQDALSRWVGAGHGACFWDVDEAVSTGMSMSALRTRAEGWAATLRGHGIRLGAGNHAGKCIDHARY